MTVPGVTVMWCNAGFERVTGYPKEETEGQNCRFLQGERTEPKVVSKMVRALRKAKELVVKVTNYRKDGSRFVNDLSLTPVHDSKGVYRYSLGVLSDLDKQSREERAAVEQLRELLPRKLPAKAQPLAFDPDDVRVDKRSKEDQYRAAQSMFTRLQWTLCGEESLEMLAANPSAWDALTSFLKASKEQGLADFWMESRKLSTMRGAAKEMRGRTMCEKYLGMSGSETRSMDASAIERKVGEVTSQLANECLPRFIKSKDCASLVEEHVDKTSKLDDSSRGLIWDQYQVPEDLAGFIYSFASFAESFPACIVLSDMAIPGNPMLYVNREFCRVTGFAKKEAQGRNCRFLQGPRTEPASVAIIQDTLRRGADCFVKITNYRKNGDVFQNLLSMRPVHDSNGVYRLCFGVQFEVDGGLDLKQRLHKLSLLLELLPSEVQVPRSGSKAGPKHKKKTRRKEERAEKEQLAEALEARNEIPDSALDMQGEERFADHHDEMLEEIAAAGGSANGHADEERSRGSPPSSRRTGRSREEPASWSLPSRSVEALEALRDAGEGRGSMPRGGDGTWLGAMQEALADVPVAVAITDMTVPGVTVMWCNAGFERVTGYPKEETEGQNCRFLQGERTEPKVVSKMVRALRKAKELVVKVTNYRKDGSRFVNDLSLTPVHDSKGVYRYSLGVLSDLDKQSREERAAVEQLRELLPRKLPAKAQPLAFDPDDVRVDKRSKEDQYRAAQSMFTRLQWTLCGEESLEMLAANPSAWDALTSFLKASKEQGLADFWMESRKLSTMRGAAKEMRGRTMCEKYLGMSGSETRSMDASAIERKVGEVTSQLANECLPRFIKSKDCASLVEEHVDKTSKLDDSSRGLIWDQYQVPEDLAGFIYSFASFAESFPACIVLSDMAIPGNPMLYVNREFCRVTGFAKKEAQGRNCRFLQGPRTEPASVAIIQDTLRRGADCFVKITNYRKNGDVFQNLLSMRPVHDSNGVYRLCFGVQFEVDGGLDLKQRLHKLSLLLELLPSEVQVPRSGSKAGPKHKKKTRRKEERAEKEQLAEALEARNEIPDSALDMQGEERFADHHDEMLEEIAAAGGLLSPTHSFVGSDKDVARSPSPFASPVRSPSGSSRESSPALARRIRRSDSSSSKSSTSRRSTLDMSIGGVLVEDNDLVRASSGSSGDDEPLDTKMGAVSGARNATTSSPKSKTAASGSSSSSSGSSSDDESQSEKSSGDSGVDSSGSDSSDERPAFGARPAGVAGGQMFGAAPGLVGADGVQSIFATTEKQGLFANFDATRSSGAHARPRASNAGKVDAKAPKGPSRTTKLTETQFYVGIASWILLSSPDALEAADNEEPGALEAPGEPMLTLEDIDFDARATAKTGHDSEKDPQQTAVDMLLGIPRISGALLTYVEQLLATKRLKADALVEPSRLLQLVDHVATIPDGVTEDHLSAWASATLGLMITDPQDDDGDDDDGKRKKRAAKKSGARDAGAGRATYTDLLAVLRRLQGKAGVAGGGRVLAVDDAPAWRKTALRVAAGLGMAKANMILAAQSASASEQQELAARMSEIPELIISHSSAAYRWFYALFILCVLWDAVLVPVEICFLGRAASNVGLLGVNIAMDIIYLARIVVRFRVSYVNEHSVVVYTPKAIAGHYLSTDFPYDIFANWPHNFFALAVGAPTEVPYILRLLRLLNIRYFWGDFQAWLKTRPDDDLKSGLLHYLGVLLYTAHIGACLWNLCAFSPGAENAETNWFEIMRSVEATVGADPDRPTRGLFQEYVTCLWFVMSMLSTLGLAQLPSHYGEIGYFVCAMILNMTVYAWTVGQISALVMKQDDEIVAKRGQLEIVQNYLQTIRVPQAIKAQIDSFFQARLKDASFTSVQAEQIYDMLPVTLQLEVSKYTNRHLVGRAALLQDCSEPFKDRFSALLREKRLEPETIVFRISEACNELLLIKSGAMELYDDIDIESAEQSDLDVREAGTFVGGMAFTCGLRHFKNARTVSGVDTIIFTISKEAFKDLVKGFPQEEGIMMDSAMSNYEIDGDGDGQSEKTAKSRLSIKSGASKKAASTVFTDRQEDVQRSDLEMVIIAARDKRDDLHLSRLCTACAKGDCAVAEDIIANTTIDLNRGNRDGRRAMHLAASGGHTDAILLLCDYDADVNVEDLQGSTPLSDALRHGQRDAAQCLWDKGARPGVKDLVNEVFGAAADAGSHAKLKLFCHFGCDMNMADADRRTALHIAAAEGNEANCALLIEYGAAVNSKDRWGCTPLQDAMLSGNDACCKLLLEKGSMLGDYDVAEHLCQAASKDDVAALQSLVKFRCSVNSQDGLGRAPLHVAAACVQINACNFLLSVEGVDVNLGDAYGHTPYDEAAREESNDHPIVLSLIKKHGGRPGGQGTALVPKRAHIPQYEELQLAADERIIQDYRLVLSQASEMKEWVQEKQQDVRIFGLTLEEALTLESEQGHVLADQMPELWTDIREFLDGHLFMRRQLTEAVYPMVKRWTNEARAQDFIRVALREMETYLMEMTDRQQEGIKTIQRMADASFKTTLAGEMGATQAGAGNGSEHQQQAEEAAARKRRAIFT